MTGSSEHDPLRSSQTELYHLAKASGGVGPVVANDLWAFDAKGLVRFARAVETRVLARIEAEKKEKEDDWLK